MIEWGVDVGMSKRKRDFQKNRLCEMGKKLKPLCEMNGNAVIKILQPAIKRHAWPLSNFYCEAKDLQQEGIIGVLKGIKKLDPTQPGSGYRFLLKYALGEMHIYRRDHGYLMKLPRAMNWDERRDLRMVSLNTPVHWYGEGGADLELIETLPGADVDFTNLVELSVMKNYIDTMPSPDKEILQYKLLGYSQRCIGEEVGFSQMHVSRITKRAIATISTFLN